MYKSIQHFNELGVKKIEKVVESFITDESMDIGDFVISLDKPLRELQRAIIKETLEEIDKVYISAIYDEESIRKIYIMGDGGRNKRNDGPIIRKRRKIYTDVWSHQTTAGSVGVVNGMYHLTKALRGICG